MSLELRSPCKVNLLLNILGRRDDGFHELETVIQPIAIHDALTFEKARMGVALTCSDASLAVDDSNLVHRAATRFLQTAGLSSGVRIHLVKNLPVAAGLGGGSANAAITLRGLNRLFGDPLDTGALVHLASGLGSDIPFFLQEGPAVCTGRGEQIESLGAFPALQGKAILLIRPAFGVSTGWAYQALSGYPEAVCGRPGRAAELVRQLQKDDLDAARDSFFNALETPVFNKYPWLALLKEDLMNNGARAAMMSGSGSTTFAITDSVPSAESLREHVLSRHGRRCWTGVTGL